MQDAAPQGCPVGGFYILRLSAPPRCVRQQRPSPDPQLHQNIRTLPDPEDRHPSQTLPVCGHFQREAWYALCNITHGIYD